MPVFHWCLLLRSFAIWVILLYSVPVIELMSPLCCFSLLPMEENSVILCGDSTWYFRKHVKCSNDCNSVLGDRKLF